MKKKLYQKMMSLFLVAAMTVTPLVPQTVAAKTESLTPAYRWDFETVSDKSVENSGAVSDGTATLQGTAKVAAEQIEIGGTSYPMRTTMYYR